MEAASLPVRPSNIAPINAINIPSCAAAPSRRLLGLAINGPKSVLAPIAKNINGGYIPSFTPWYR